MRVAVGSDHAGFALKEAVKAFLSTEYGGVLDLGTHNADPVDYSDYAEAIGRTLRENRAQRGILLCGSGVGASMAANRIPGIRAGLCHDTYSAHQARHLWKAVGRDNLMIKVPATPQGILAVQALISEGVNVTLHWTARAHSLATL